MKNRTKFRKFTVQDAIDFMTKPIVNIWGFKVYKTSKIKGKYEIQK